MANNSKKIIGLVVVSIFIFLLLFLNFCKKEMSEYNLEIADSGNNIWRVYDQEGNTRGTLEVSPNDRVNWEAVNSDLEFRFEVDVSRYFDFDEDVFMDNRTHSVRDGGELNLTIKKDAPLDTLTYHVYVASADTFVVGNSPPVIIIKRR